MSNKHTTGSIDPVSRGLPAGAGKQNFTTNDSTTRSRECRAKFRFRQKGAHLTYAGHLEYAELAGHIQEKFHNQEYKWHSLVWESSDKETAYDHTHFAFEFIEKLDSTNSRIFDFTPNMAAGTTGIAIHPHIQLFTNDSHKYQIYEQYHLKAPIEGSLNQSTTSPRPTTTLLERIRNAPTLYDACQEAGVDIDSVSGVKAIREDKGRTPNFDHNHPDSAWVTRPITRCSYWWGPSGLGKTEFAVHQFKNPLLVTELDDLRNFDPTEHDGIVFDDMQFSYPEWTTQKLIHLTDWDQTRTIKCRYTNAIIPKHTRKVFTSNMPISETFQVGDPAGAIRRRITDNWHITEKTWIDPPTLPEEPLPDMEWFDNYVDTLGMDMDEIPVPEGSVVMTDKEMNEFNWGSFSQM